MDQVTSVLDQLTQRARDMVPALRDRAGQTEAERTVSADTIGAFQKAGFFKIFQPKRYGGYELDYGPTQLALGGEIGRGCGSSAWVLTVVACHSWMLGMFPEQAQDDVWKNEPDALLSSGVFPDHGHAERVNGGVEISGRWRFSSGVDHAQWALIGNMIQRDKAPPEIVWCLIPRQDFAIEDTWYVNGLRGTGSKDLVVAKAFIPEHRVVGFDLMAAGRGPGTATNANHIYRMPLFPVFPFNICAPALGVARGALETYAENYKKHPPRPMGPPTPGLDPLLLRLAEAGAQIDAAAALLQRDALDLNNAMRADGHLSPDQAGRIHRDLSYACGQFTAAVDTLFYMSGAHGLFDGMPIQRAFRDVHAVNAHVGLRWESCAAGYVRAALGIETPTAGRH